MRILPVFLSVTLLLILTGCTNDLGQTQAAIPGATSIVEAPTPPAPETKEPEVALLLRQLRSPDMVQRTSAGLALQDMVSEANRDLVTNELMSIVIEGLEQRTPQEDSSLHQAIWLIGKLQVTEAYNILIDNIDYRIQLKAGAKYPTGYEYPAAYALSKLDEDKVLNAVIDQIAVESHVTNRTLLTWVVYAQVGSETGRQLLIRTSRDRDGYERDRLMEAADDILQGNLLVTGPPG